MLLAHTLIGVRATLIVLYHMSSSGADHHDFNMYMV